MSQELVAEFERRLGCFLPSGYAAFLSSHTDRCLDPSLIFPVRDDPPFGSPCTLDELLTASDLIGNDKQQLSGIPDLGLLHIGGDVLGLSLYMRVTDDGFGRILVAAPPSRDCFDVADDFDAFLAICTPEMDTEP
ncbi:MAG: SMI1/KNR4 family protein [Planctomycetota bacterium]